MPPFIIYHSLFTTNTKSPKCFRNYLVWTGYLGPSGTFGATELPFDVGGASGSAIGVGESCGRMTGFTVGLLNIRILLNRYV